MPGTVVNLHVAASMAELNANVNVPPSAKAELLLKTAPKVLENAEKCSVEGDQEKAYVLYMKYVGLAKNIRLSREYKKDKKYFDAMLATSDIMVAVAKSEELSNSLAKRYEAKKQAKEAKEMERKTAKMRLEEEARAAEAKLDSYAMEPTQLYSLMNEKSTNFLLFDARPAADYRASHIGHAYSLNVSEEILKPGATPRNIERDLHIEDRLQWGRRNKVDKLILFDWNSEEFLRNIPLTYLKDALYKWDQGVTYQCAKPFILKGGFDNFAIHYPMKVTDAKKSRLPERLMGTKGTQFGKMPNFRDVEYPEDLLENGFIKTPSPKPPVSKSIDDAIRSGALTVSNGPETTSTQQRLPLKPAIPDRSAKPRIMPTPAAISMTTTDSWVDDDTKDLDDFSVSSSGAHNNARLFDSKSINSAASNSVASELNDAFMNSVGSISIDSTVNAPLVDRSLKAKMLLSRGRVGGSIKGQVAEVLEAEKELAEESLQLERQELRLEEKWQVMRLKREKEAEEDMRAEMAKTEENLLEELRSLTIDKESRDEENELLRKQLQEMKKDIESNVAQRVDEAVAKKVEEAIKEKDDERQKLQQEVEAKRMARKKMKETEKRKEREIQETMRKRDEYEREVRIAKEKQRKKNVEESAAAAATTMPATKRVPLKDEPSSSFNLNRSYSSPNIAQMLEEEDRKAAAAGGHGLTAIPSPGFDRTTKPSANNRAPRNFQPIWGTGKKGLTGLKNLGNTCYMNSILQCLSNFTLPSQYFMDTIFQRDLNESSETRGEVALEYSELIRAIWSGQYKSVAPVDLKRVVGKYRDSFSGYSQQDAHEFLLFLMEMLHNDVNEVRGKVRLPEVDFDKMNEFEGSEKAWNLDKQADKSFIRETFYGQRKSSLQCQSCGYESPKYEAFFELALTLPSGNGKCSVRDLIANELRTEKVDWKCPKCKRVGNAHKKIDIVKFPLILTIHLKRFYHDDIWRKKQNYVDFDLNNLNLGQFAGACGGRKNRYKEYHLFGVTNHFGTMEGGHYTGYCYSQVYDKWHKYDDQEVSSMTASNVKTSAAYILFYSAKN
jgi:ubiquitin carboxyl-terminal hydrolase 8